MFPSHDQAVSQDRDRGERVRIKLAQRGYCLASTKLDGNSIQALSSLPGFKKWVGRDLLFAPTGANINHLHKFWPDAEWMRTHSMSLMNTYSL